jgi:hypothetical protein
MPHALTHAPLLAPFTPLSQSWPPKALTSSDGLKPDHLTIRLIAPAQASQRLLERRQLLPHRHLEKRPQLLG